MAAAYLPPEKIVRDKTDQLAAVVNVCVVEQMRPIASDADIAPLPQKSVWLDGAKST